MTVTRHLVEPDGIAPPAANYAHAVLTRSADATWLHTSGILPIEFDGTVPTNLAGQAAAVWDNIAAILTAADMEPEHVVSVTTYTTPGIDLATVMGARDRALGGHRAASTLVTVAELAQPAWLFEVAIVAVR